MKKIIKIFKKAIELLTKEEFDKFLKLQLYMIVAGILQILSVGLIFPMMDILLNPVERIPDWWSEVMRLSGITGKESLYFLGAFLIITFTLSTLFILATRKKMIVLGHMFGASISAVYIPSI